MSGMDPGSAELLKVAKGVAGGWRGIYGGYLKKREMKAALDDSLVVAANKAAHSYADPAKKAQFATRLLQSMADHPIARPARKPGRLDSLRRKLGRVPPVAGEETSDFPIRLQDQIADAVADPRMAGLLLPGLDPPLIAERICESILGEVAADERACSKNLSTGEDRGRLSDD